MERIAESFRHVGVIGAGAFGLALACAALRAGREVTLWGRDAAGMAALARTRRSDRLPGIAIPQDLAITADAGEAAAADLLILAVPAQALRTLCEGLAPHAGRAVPAVVAAKGIERATGAFVTDIVAELLPEAVPAILSGPSFAADVATGSPTALTLACDDAGLGEALARAIGSASFRLYHSTDRRGVEIGGAAKNVLAIAAGVAAGRGYGESTVAALIARGFAELTRFGIAHGARPETLAGLSGLGDLILTGTSSRSRNRRFGEALGRGAVPEAAARETGLVEGAWTAGVMVEMAAAAGIDMPLARAVADLVAGRAGVDEAVSVLLARPQRAEAD